MSRLGLDPGMREKLVKNASESGFPFQLRVEHELQKLRTLPKLYPGDEPWTLFGTEVGWGDPASGAGGYIDIVMRRGRLFLVIECKRIASGHWTFLTPTSAAQPRHHAYYCVASEGAVTTASATDILPEGIQSEYCVVGGKGEQRKRALERTAGELVLASERFAHVYAGAMPGTPQGNFPAVFVPVLVCSQCPAVIAVDVDNIEIGKGVLPPDSEVKLEPFIRFQKTLSRSLRRRATNLEGLYEGQARTVAVVHADYLSDFLARKFSMVERSTLLSATA